MLNKRMPVKIGFQVISSTGEDDRYRASELNYHGPTVRGWRSSINCKFPQEIILQLKVPTILHQIQILAHQYLIPHKVEICTSNGLDSESVISSNSDLFDYLGFITFSDNKETGFRSRELKSILIPSRKARYVKLRILSNHVNFKNTFNQVALVAVNILGDVLNSTNDNNERNNNIWFHHSPSDPDLTCNANYISPYDDLAFEMYVDKETAKVMKMIEYKKFQAVCEEQFDYANALKITLDNLRAAGEILGLYEQEKRQAINLEDYDKAKVKKLQIDHYRKKVYAALHIEQILGATNDIEEYETIPATIDPETVPVENTRFKAPTNGREYIYEQTNSSERHYENSPRRLPNISPSHLPKSKSQILKFESRQPASPSPYKNQMFSSPLHNPQPNQSFKGPMTRKDDITASFEGVRTPSSTTSSSVSEESPLWKPHSEFEYSHERPYNDLESLVTERNVENSFAAVEEKTSFSVPTNYTSPKKSSRGLNKSKLKTSVSEHSKISKAKSTFEAYEDRMLPALRSYHGNEIVRECQLNFDPPQKSILNEREKKQAMLPISVFGIEMIEKFYSKSFSDKEEGLKELQQELKAAASTEATEPGSKPPLYNKIARAAVFLLHRALRDKVFSVYSCAAETVRLFFAEYVPQRVSPPEVARSVEKLLPELLAKSGDVTPRIHNMAAHTLLSMAECEEVRRLNIIPVHLSRPLTSSVHPRLALSRLEMVEQLILNHGISKDKKSGLTCRTLAEFGSSGLHHPAEAVRKVSERILIQVYKVNPKIVRKQLPPDDNVTRRNLLYRHLFQEFDVMDIQRKLDEQTINESNTTFEINKNLHNSDLFSINETESKKSVKLNMEPPLENLKNSVSFSENQMEKRITSSNQKNVNELISKEKPEMLENKLRSKIFPPNNAKIKTEVNLRFSPTKKSQKKMENSQASVKFPSLVDSIYATKARMVSDQNKISKLKKIGQIFPKNQTFSPENNRSSLGNNETSGKKITKRDVSPYTSFSSNIPVPVFGPGPKLANSSKRLEKLLKNEIPVKDKNDVVSSSKLKKMNTKDDEKNVPENQLNKIKMKNFQNVQEGKVSMDNANHGWRKSDVNFDNKGTEGSARLSESMLASIRGNEQTLSCISNQQENKKEGFKTCIFCLCSKKWATEDGLNDHYLKDCLMLTTCKYCMEVVEISTYTNHLLADCQRKYLFQKCTSCQEAIVKELYDTHVCKGSNNQINTARCPFCHTDIGERDTSWRKHLVGSNICLNHPRQKRSIPSIRVN